MDFHWNVNGKTYDFSIPGGGFVGFTDLVETLGIVDSEAKEFVADVVNVEFSSPELVDVSKAEIETTVGQIKEDRGLKCQYSTKLTEKQIREINAQTVEAGDWALISMRPFESEETLTVTMKDGAQFTVGVTDAQIREEILTGKGNLYEVTVIYDEYAEIPEGSRLVVKEYRKDEEEFKTAKELVEKHTDGKAAEGTDSENSAEVFDISIINSDGYNVEPKAAVKVSIERKGLPESVEKGQLGRKMSLYHISEQKNEAEVELVATENEQADGTIVVERDAVKNEYDTEAFSPFVLNWSSDDWCVLHYGYMEGNNFIDFPDNMIDASKIQFDNSAVHRLIYDVPGYQYADTRISTEDSWNKKLNLKYAERIAPYIYRKEVGPWYNRDTCYFYETFQAYNYDNAVQSGLSEDPGSKHIYVTYEKKPDSTNGGTLQIDPEKETLGQPEILKSSTDNHNGTNTLSLDIKAPEKDIKRADIIVIYDVSGSMAYDIERKSPAPTSDPDKQRMTLTQAAVQKLAEDLMTDNDQNDPAIRMGLVSFSNGAQIEQGLTGKKDDFQNAVGELGADGGTNWEAALLLANSMEVRDNAETFVIFVTDGDPTFRITREPVVPVRNPKVTDRDLVPDGGFSSSIAQCDMNDLKFAYPTLGVFGTGTSNLSVNSQASLDRNYYAALAETEKILNQGKHFLSIGISPDILNLQKFTREAAKDTGKSTGCYNARNKSDLDDIVTKIKDEISAKLGYTDVSIKDGITGLTAMMGKHPGLWSQVSSSSDPNGYFTYYRMGSKYGNTPVKWDPTKAGAGTATYNAETGSVEWNLGDDFVLEDGVTYRVSFNVWPSQEAYDLLAELAKDPSVYDGLSDDIKAQIIPDGQGGFKLRTNTPNPSDPGADPKDYTVYASYKPCVVSGGNVTQTGEQQKKRYNDVEPMPLQKTKLKVRKVWEDGGFIKNRAPVTLIVKQGDDEYQRIELTESDALSSDASIWQKEVFIATGLKVGGHIYESGHDYSIDEVDNGYHYEFESSTVHPMLIDSWSQIEYGQDGVDYLKAVNKMRGWVDINKKVFDADGTTDISSTNRTKFHFRVNLETADGTPIRFENYAADTETAEEDRIKVSGK